MSRKSANIDDLKLKKPKGHHHHEDARQHQLPNRPWEEGGGGESSTLALAR